MQLVPEKAGGAKKRSKVEGARRKVSHKVDRLVNTPGASRKLVAAAHEPDLSTPTLKKKKRPNKKEKIVKKAQHLVADQRDRLKGPICLIFLSCFLLVTVARKDDDHGSRIKNFVYYR